MASSGAGVDGRRGPEDLFRFVCVDCVCRRRATSEHFDHLLGVDFGVGPVAVDNGRRSLLFFLPSPSLFFSLKRRIGWIPIFGIPPPFHRPPLVSVYRPQDRRRR